MGHIGTVIGSAAGVRMEAPRIPQRIERLPMTSYQRFIGVVIVAAWYFDDIDLGAMTFLLPSLSKEFHLTVEQAGLLGSMSFAGMFFGTMASGFLSDKIGRKAILQWSMIIWGLGGLMIAVAWNPISLFAFRFVLGFGLGAELPVATAMLPELLPKGSRGRYVAIMEGLLPIGIISAGAIAYFVLPSVGWRWVFVVQALPAFWLLVIRRRLPESPRWLEAVGRTQEADQVMTIMEQEIEKRYGKPLPSVEDAKLGGQGMVKKSRFAELWSKEYYRRTVMLWILWPAALFGYYGLTTWFGSLLVAKGFSMTKSIGFIVMITSGGIPGFLLATYLIDKLGRKPVVICTLVLTAIAAYFYGQSTAYNILFMWGFLLNFFQYAMWSSVYAYTPELYPTRIRATGAGLASSVGRIGALLGPYVIGAILVSYGAGSVFSLAAALFGVAALAVLILGPETKDRTLEEISQ
jgi:MFS transporter, putative metabolite:H+ symporter